ncbi:MAG: nicotinate-nucleotide pyrophosphorylase (carboxylating) [Flavobacteriales bacterium]|jgi:nicotinate-nucleotide pyrophosphorylase (carboxylating)
MIELEEWIELAVAEDVGDGDHTSLACIPANAQGRAHLLVKDPGVISGIEYAKVIFYRYDPKLELEIFKADGDRVEVGDIVFVVKGSSRSILTSERVVLNVMQRMSGIATTTRSIVDSIGDSNTKILDTRKTTPALRAIEKQAVLHGGGYNHRIGLYDMIMIKDNHIDYAGGIDEAIEATHKYLTEHQKDLQIEIEVRDMDELNQVLEIGRVHRIMLDNFTPAEIKTALKIIDGKYETEASGGINASNVGPYALTGVEYISMGALTHSVKSLDLSLKAF